MRNFTLAALLLLSGCGTTQYVWNKPGLNQKEFAQDKYACVQEARSPTSSAYMAGGYFVGNSYVPAVGGASSGEIVNGNFFKPCMEARGYALTTAQSASAFQELKTKVTALDAQWRACATATRSKPQYAVLVPHFSDLAGAYSMAQLTDKSLATPAEAQALGAYIDEMDSSCAMQYRASASALAPAVGPAYEQHKTAVQRAVVLLVERKMTWGDYAQAATQAREELKAQLNQIRI